MRNGNALTAKAFSRVLIERHDVGRIDPQTNVAAVGDSVVAGQTGDQRGARRLEFDDGIRAEMLHRLDPPRDGDGVIGRLQVQELRPDADGDGPAARGRMLHPGDRCPARRFGR